MTESKTLFPDPKLVEIGDRDTKEICKFEINEFYFENRIKFIKIVTSIFKDVFKSDEDLRVTENIQLAGRLVEVAGERMLDIYEIVLDKPKEWIKRNLTLKKEIELISAILEVNDIPFLISQSRKLLGTLKSV